MRFLKKILSKQPTFKEGEYKNLLEQEIKQDAKKLALRLSRDVLRHVSWLYDKGLLKQKEMNCSQVKFHQKYKSTQREQFLRFLEQEIAQALKNEGLTYYSIKYVPDDEWRAYIWFFISQSSLTH
jgi:hypothetical protein